MTMLREDGPQEAAIGRLPDAMAVLAASPVPTLLIEPAPPDTAIAYVNPALLALTEFAQADLVGESLASLASRQGDRAGWGRLRDAVATGQPAEAEMLCARKDGSSFWGALHLVPLGPSGGHLCQIVDVTRRVDAEGALALSQQREALGLLTNSVAHEFNNFLQILIGYIDGLKRRLGDRQEPFIQRALSRSTEAAERAAVLTRQLLTHSRRIAPEVRPVDLDAMVETIAEHLRTTLPKSVTLAVKPLQGLPPALCNPTQVELALRHIVMNAVEALSRQGVVEIATFAVPPGDRSLQRPGDGAVGIAIRDTGHGMSPEMATRALVPFATSREAGRGVGLAIVHGLMKRQNGTIAFDSRPGEGTTVRLVFPAAA